MSKHKIEWLNHHPFAGIPDTAKLTGSCSQEVYALIEASGYRGTKLLTLKTIQGLSRSSDKSESYSYTPGYSWSSKAKLAEMMGIDKRQMERHLSDLLEDGVLIRGLRMGHKEQNLYSVDFAVIEQSNRAVVRRKEAERKKTRLAAKRNRVSSESHSGTTPHGVNTAMPTAITPSTPTATTPSTPTATTPYPPTALTPPNNSKTVVGHKFGQQLPVSAMPPKPAEVGLGSAESKSYCEPTNSDVLPSQSGDSKGNSPTKSAVLPSPSREPLEEPTKAKAKAPDTGEANLLVMPERIEFSTALEAKFQSWRSRESAATREAFQRLHEQWTDNPYGLAEFEPVTYKLMRVLRAGVE